MTYQELLQELQGVDEWLWSLGLSPRRDDRLHRAIAVTKSASERWLESNSGESHAPIGNLHNYIFALTELLEFVQIYRAFRGDSSKSLTEKLKTALSGPFEASKETPKNSAGRNSMFELALAAEWRLRGLDVMLGEPDLLAQIGGIPFVVECKRPFGWKGVVHGFKEAKRQLTPESLDLISPSALGVIVVSLSRVMIEGRKMLFLDSMEQRSQLADFLEAELADHKPRWHGIKFHERMAAVLFHLTLPTDIGKGEHFALLSQLNGYQAGASDHGLRVLERQFSAIYV